MSRLVVVLLGTDHHPFDRLVDWADAAAMRDPACRVMVQHGATHPPAVAAGQDFMPHAEILQLLDEASAVVCHGGPGTIMDARGLGHVPVCVPRDPHLDEHVDGHQLRFAALADRAGVVRTVRTVADFHATLEQIIVATSAGRPRTGPPSLETDAARERLACELDRLSTSPSPHASRRWATGGRYLRIRGA